MAASASQRNSNRRPDIEKLLQEMKVQFSFLAGIPTTKFDLDQSLKNQARIEALDPEVSSRYTDSVANGDQFPPVIAWRPAKTRNPPLVIIDGNHRLVAHRENKQPIDVYEIDKSTPRKTIHILSIVLNTTHGVGLNEAERIRHAIFLVDSGYRQEDAAARVNLSKSRLARELKVRKGEERARQTSAAREWEGVKNGSVKSLLASIKTDEGFGPAVKLTYKAGLAFKQVQELVEAVNATRSGVQQKKVVTAFEGVHADRIAEGGGGKVGAARQGGMGPRQRLGSALGQLAALPEDVTGLVRTYGKAEAPEMASRCLETAEKLRKLALALDPDIDA